MYDVQCTHTHAHTHTHTHTHVFMCIHERRPHSCQRGGAKQSHVYALRRYIFPGDLPCEHTARTDSCADGEEAEDGEAAKSWLTLRERVERKRRQKMWLQVLGLGF